MTSTNALLKTVAELLSPLTTLLERTNLSILMRYIKRPLINLKSS